jgi:hypothetical protein
MPARWPAHSLVRIMISLVITSSFFWVSPWTFWLSSAPMTPTRAPLLTALEMTLMAVTRSFSRAVKSPVAPAMWRCSSMMNWVSVVPVCMKRPFGK